LDKSLSAPTKSFLSRWRNGWPVSLADRTHLFAKLIDDDDRGLWATAMGAAPIPLLQLRKHATAGVERRPVVSTLTPAQRETRHIMQCDLMQPERFAVVYQLYEHYLKSLPAGRRSEGTGSFASDAPAGRSPSFTYSDLSKRALPEFLVLDPAAELNEDSKEASDAAKKEGCFLAFLKELWARLIFFAECETLTATFYGWNGRLRAGCASPLQVLFHNELRLINAGDAFDKDLSRVARHDLPPDKIRQLLRGIATWRAMELLRGSRLPGRAWMLWEVGTVVWPSTHLQQLGKLIADIHAYPIEMTEGKFHHRLAIMRQEHFKSRRGHT
jgi:hypothetical protein